MNRMLTVPEVAELIGKAPFTVRKMARLGKLPGARRIGRDWRFVRTMMERFTEGGRR